MEWARSSSSSRWLWSVMYIHGTDSGIWSGVQDVPRETCAIGEGRGRDVRQEHTHVFPSKAPSDWCGIGVCIVLLQIRCGVRSGMRHPRRHGRIQPAECKNGNALQCTLHWPAQRRFTCKIGEAELFGVQRTTRTKKEKRDYRSLTLPPRSSWSRSGYSHA